jgi:hypothetical protein
MIFLLMSASPRMPLKLLMSSRQCINSSHFLLHIFSLKICSTLGVVKLEFHDVFSFIVHLVLVYAH